MTEQTTEPTRSLTEMNRDALELLKRTVCKGASDDELKLFGYVCKRTGLDPFVKQIYGIMRWSSSDQRKVLTIQVSIDGMRLLADRTGKYKGSSDPEWCDSAGVWHEVWLEDTPPVAARVYVTRSDFDAPVCGIARYRAYVQVDKDKQPVHLWATMADTMLAKCAESQALRRAFPVELSGLYSAEEMMQADNRLPATTTTTAGDAHEFDLITIMQDATAMIDNPPGKLTNKQLAELVARYEFTYQLGMERGVLPPTYIPLSKPYKPRQMCDSILQIGELIQQAVEAEPTSE